MNVLTWAYLGSCPPTATFTSPVGEGSAPCALQQQGGSGHRQRDHFDYF